MRRIRRPSVSLPTLASIRANYPLSAEGDADDLPDDRWNDPDVRGAVYAMHGRVCAYCQRQASDSRGDVEHFRPKADYPWLTYEFVNYLLGCRVCNSNRKSNRFPLAPRAKPLRFQLRMVEDRDFLARELAREKRLLLDPVDDPVDEWIDLDWESALCPIEPSRRALADREGKRRVPKTIEFFGFNTIPELITDRVTHVNAVLHLLEKWRDGDEATATELRAFANRYKPHGWAVRRILGELAPDLELAPLEDDLRWFVDESLDRLDRDDLILERELSRRDREMVLKRRNEVRWTLAVLWHEPPGVTPETIETWIDARGRRDEIDDLRRHL